MIVAGAVSAAAENPPERPLQTWIRVDRDVFRARFISLGEDTVRLMLEDGRAADVPLRWLSPQSQRQAAESAAKKADQSIREVREMSFVLVEDGRFTMGSPINESGRLTGIGQAEMQVAAAAATPAPVLDVEPEHEVTIRRDFWIKQTEVSWDEWNAVKKYADDYKYPDIGKGRCGSVEGLSGDHPVTDITWLDAVKWCNLKSELEGLTPAYYTTPVFAAADTLRNGNPVPFVKWDAAGYRLPTEAEWEFACRERGRKKNAFYQGDLSKPGFEPLDGSLDKVGWYGGNSGGSTHPVQQKAANKLGLFDMHGNVAEWCWDWEGLLSAEEAEDPRGAEEGLFRVFRGGSWADPARCCRAAYRVYYSPVAPSSVLVGFRPIRGSDGNSRGSRK